MPEFRDQLPEIVAPVPGPRSQALRTRLERVECPDTTYLADDFPVFWERASGANVWDVDGNRYVDLSGAFGVSTLGHAHPDVTAAVQRQSERLLHAMGDVHPSAVKVELAEKLAALAPGGATVVLFGLSGSDAIEAALKTAVVVTGRPGVVAFEDGYHGLSYGALAATARRDFREMFAAQLNPHVRHVPYPDPQRRPYGGGDAAEEAARAVQRLEDLLRTQAGDAIGAVLVEPIQGRGGVVVPHASFLRGLRSVCDRFQRLLIVDEIFTGLGRTGRWFACEHSNVVPDLLCVGKSLAGGLPLSACLGKPEIMRAWERSKGEARHTSTFLGHPPACAAALVVLDLLQRHAWPERVAQEGESVARELQVFRDIDGVSDVRGIGWLWGIELQAAGARADRTRTFHIVREALQRGYILLGSGTRKNVLQLTPPFVLSARQRHAAWNVLGELLQSSAAPPLTGTRNRPSAAV